MKIKFLIASLLLIGLSNCGPAEEKKTGEDPVCDAKCQNESTTLKASLTSAHLGNYSDCPQDAYSEKPDTDSIGGALAADCDSDDCGVLNCEKASAILRLSSGGDDVLGVLVQKIELKNEAGDTVAILPLESVTRVDDNQQFSGRVPAGETVSIRVDYQGPLNVNALVSDQSDDGDSDSRLAGPGVYLQITLSSQNASDVVVKSPAVSTIPSVDT